MSMFAGFRFFALLFTTLVPAVVLGLKEKSLRYYRDFLTILFVILVFKNSILQFLYLIAYMVLSLFVIKLYMQLRIKYKRNKKIYIAAILLVIIPLIYSKISVFAGKNIFGFLGLSYIFFRVIQIIIEIYDGVIKEVNIFETLEFLLFFPSLSSGPIDRSRRFLKYNSIVYSKYDYDKLLSSGIVKLILGLVYKYPIASIFYFLLNGKIKMLTGCLHWIAYSYTYGLYMFFDFAGYSLMAIGTAYILGIKLPDNFNKPFISVDMKDFWNRWHISLSHWFRDFVFTRLIIGAARKKITANRLLIATISLVINMTLMGLWHGLQSHYILYGIYHGVLLAFTELYQKKSKFYKKYKNNRIYLFVSWFVTINLVMFGFLIFSGKIPFAF